MTAAQVDLFSAPPTAMALVPASVRAHGCRCEQCCPDDPAPTYTEAYRHECEVRYLARLPSNEHRREYLEGQKGVLERRGHDEYYRLRSATWSFMRQVQR